jgi:hypothetical protein
VLKQTQGCSLTWIAQPGISANVSIFLHDATRFILNRRSIIDPFPLQVLFFRDGFRAKEKRNQQFIRDVTENEPRTKSGNTKFTGMDVSKMAELVPAPQQA